MKDTKLKITVGEKTKCSSLESPRSFVGHVPSSAPRCSHTLMSSDNIRHQVQMWLRLEDEEAIMNESLCCISRGNDKYMTGS